MIKKNLAIILVVVAAIFIVIGVRYLSIATQAPKSGSYSEGKATVGGPFTLVDENGRTVTEKDFLGKFMLLYIGYTFCPDVCPTNLSIMAQALDQLTPEELARITPVFITIDPARDTVDQVKQYTDAFHPALVGLTGSEEQVREAARAFKAYFARVEGEGASDYLMDHSSITYLMGPDGSFVRIFQHATPSKDIVEGLRAAFGQ